MSGKGNCFDNAPIESFWGVLNNELVYQQNYGTRLDAISDLIGYIELYYNEKRLAKQELCSQWNENSKGFGL